MKPEDKLGMGGCVDDVERSFVGAPLVGAGEVDEPLDIRLLPSVADEAILALLKWRFFLHLCKHGVRDDVGLCDGVDLEA